MDYYFFFFQAEDGIRDRGRRVRRPRKQRRLESMTLPKNLEVARQAKLEPLNEVAARIGIGEHLLEPYGEGVAKIKLAAIEELLDRPKPKSVGVSAITPTPLGEGKTTTTVGL